MEKIDFMASFRKYLLERIVSSDNNELSVKQLEDNRAIKFVNKILQNWYDEK